MSKTVKLQRPTEDYKVREINTSGFNVGGLIFGPLMYMGWGMWKKGGILFGVMLVAIILSDIIAEMTGLLALRGVANLGSLVSLYCGFTINKDNYQHLLNKGWKQVDKKVKKDGAVGSQEKTKFPILWIIVPVIVAFTAFSLIAENYQDTEWNSEKGKRIAECEEMYGGGKYCECTIDYLEEKVGIQGIVEINNQFKNDKKIPPIIIEAGQSCQQYFDETNIYKVNQLMEDSGIELE